MSAGGAVAPSVAIDSELLIDAGEEAASGEWSAARPASLVASISDVAGTARSRQRRAAISKARSGSAP